MWWNFSPLIVRHKIVRAHQTITLRCYVRYRVCRTWSSIRLRPQVRHVHASNLVRPPHLRAGEHYGAQQRPHRASTEVRWSTLAPWPHHRQRQKVKYAYLRVAYHGRLFVANVNTWPVACANSFLFTTTPLAFAPIYYNAVVSLGLIFLDSPQLLNYPAAIRRSLYSRNEACLKQYLSS